MKLKIFIVIVAVALAWFAGRQLKAKERGLFNGSRGDDVVQGNAPSTRQINQTLKLTGKAHVEVVNINGTVEVSEADGDTAEVHVTSNAGSGSDLDDHQIIVEHTDSSLTVRGQGNNGFGLWRWLTGGGQVRHTVNLKVPRGGVLAAHGINGKVNIGDLEGEVHVSGVNGRVEVGRATLADVSGVNGGVTLTITELGDPGASVNGINGGVELRLGSDVNADLEVNGLNGRVAVEAPNVEVQEQKRSRVRARIGKGGSNISVNGVNGGVRLVGV
ncbi:MAG TPA: hypothetical protein VJT82_03050 [Pyrinomonadaceae bacterium]|nr:hypothetical protein [Pyrinomonadaceae bacterium]